MLNARCFQFVLYSCEAAVNERRSAGGSMRIKLMVGHITGEGGESRRLLQGDNIRGRFRCLRISLQFLYELLQVALFFMAPPAVPLTYGQCGTCHDEAIAGLGPACSMAGWPNVGGHSRRSSCA